MAGNFRSGRKPEKPATVPTTKPKMPAGLGDVEAAFWKTVIATSSHLSLDDSKLAQSCCELWGLYRSAYGLAQADPCDKDIRIAVVNYFNAWKAAMERLALDPLGRKRIGNGGTPESTNPLDEFGIVG